MIVGALRRRFTVLSIARDAYDRDALSRRALNISPDDQPLHARQIRGRSGLMPSTANTSWAAWKSLVATASPLHYVNSYDRLLVAPRQAAA
jgi:hypothetical protein